ncbi:glycosyltransferase family 4 protein [Halopenitus persicus]|uniref:Glycosyltransferase involved in cell wall bisynthesis n=1 Tax=Halopenitus persicus TaxID=1048396 RepID=A0A1H3MMP4_9EURY|nr:glycosyltransferase family 4 protein [Halopenitus persicus]SDY77753.1 Glycosyltransferase involved in cell wall bisynthesis [Halopenitus persicus]
MRICHVSPRYAPHTGGVETQVQELSERLAARGHEVTVETAGRTPDLPKRERRNGVTVHRHYGLSPNEAFHFAPQLANPRLWSEYDVLHVHNVHTLSFSCAVLSSRTPTVATTYYHGHSASGFRDRLLDAYRPILRRALKSVHEVVSVSEWERRQVQSDLGVDSSVIPLGVEVSRFEGADPVVRDRPYLLCVARLEDYKGVQHVISALPELPEYDLLVAGDGPYRDTLEELAVEVGVNDRVEFLGNVDHERLPAYYAGADVHLSLSSFESFGLTVAESLASGTPCVLRSETALRDWCRGDDVECVAKVDPDTVATAVRNGGELAAPTGPVESWDDVTDSYEEIYESTF